MHFSYFSINARPQIVVIWALLLLWSVTLSGCQSAPEPKPAPVKPKNTPAPIAVCPTPQHSKPVISQPAKPCICQCDQAKKPAPITKADTKKETPIDIHQDTNLSRLTPASWHSIQWYSQQQLTKAWPAWLQSCRILKKDNKWKSVCKAANTLNNQYSSQPSNQAIQRYFFNHFNLFKLSNEKGTSSGLVTGYYQPVLKGSYTRSAQYQYPIFHTPSDLIEVSLADQYPALRHKRVRGRLNNGKLTPYYSRAEIETPHSPIAQSAFLYLDNLIDVFFLHIQGSGVVALDSGDVIQVGYANHNGHPYRSIGKILIQRGDLKASQASMKGIKQWARQHPQQVRALLNQNPSFVFFRTLPKGLPGPLGALGAPLLPEQAIAVDKRYVPLGAPVFLSTTYPNSPRPLKKLVMAQDTGGAIKGSVRADFYWGAGLKAGAKAGAMKQQGQMWVLLPKSFPTH